MVAQLKKLPNAFYFENRKTRLLIIFIIASEFFVGEKRDRRILFNMLKLRLMPLFRIIFIHGYTASSQADWYPALSKELVKLGVDYAIPDLPGGETPHAKAWLQIIHQEVRKSDKPLVLVGHSLGTRAVLLYLNKFKPQVEKAFLIAAFSNKKENGQRHDGETYPDFFEDVINIDEIKPLVNKFIIMHSQDDSSIPYTQGVEIARDLSAELITYEGKDHFCEPEDAGAILNVLRKELEF